MRVRRQRDRARLRALWGGAQPNVGVAVKTWLMDIVGSNPGWEVAGPEAAAAMNGVAVLIHHWSCPESGTRIGILVGSAEAGKEGPRVALYPFLEAGNRRFSYGCWWKPVVAVAAGGALDRLCWQAWEASVAEGRRHWDLYAVHPGLAVWEGRRRAAQLLAGLLAGVPHRWALLLHRDLGLGGEHHDPRPNAYIGELQRSRSLPDTPEVADALRGDTSPDYGRWEAEQMAYWLRWCELPDGPVPLARAGDGTPELSLGRRGRRTGSYQVQWQL